MGRITVKRRECLANVPDEGVWVNPDHWVGSERLRLDRRERERQQAGQHREPDTVEDMAGGEKTSPARTKPAL